ncbi:MULTISPECIES: MFS transporter [unclassified Marinobacter]|uniref:MFS transporter n=1 Tax=unclassified Marinobacter TaxID=83889 RepID=UPI0026E20CFB|nr:MULTISPECIES: MFS transporter [unclassified Marinobacter]MDO6442458.1 MFS transporter [Marinobacter sp. 2_MG-2023]MDO6824514.1 MFS transporter [Marinobacter sp. 1_MG-2023]
MALHVFERPGQPKLTGILRLPAAYASQLSEYAGRTGIYWRLSNLYFWFFALLGGLLPYWSLYLQGQGFSYLQIATLMATIQLTKIVAPSLWGHLGDKTGQRVRLVRLGAITGSLFFAGVFLEPGFYGLLLVMMAFTFFWNAILPLYEVITLRSLGEHRERYGKVRLWGSVGFIGAVAGVGLILDWVSISWLPWLLLPVFVGIVVSAFLLPAERGERKPPAPKGSLKAIVTHPAVVAFFLMNFLLQVSHGAYYTFFSIHLEQHGYGNLAIGLLWSLGVVSEIGLFLVMHRLTRNFTVRQIAIGALVLTMIRWVLIAALTDVLAVLLFAQLLHAASYGALHAVSVQYVQGFFGQHHHGQGQALYSGLTFGAGGALGAWMSGFLVEGLSTSAAFWGGAIAMAIAIVITTRWLQAPPDPYSRPSSSS